MGSLAKGFLRKVCGSSAENSRKFAKNTFYCVRKGCRNSAESLRKFRGNLQKFFCNDPFPNDPISELLKKQRTRTNNQGNSTLLILIDQGIQKTKERKDRVGLVENFNLKFKS